MLCKRSISCAVAVLCVCLSAAPAWAVPATKTCYRSIDAITADGVLNESSWAQAVSADFLMWDGSAPASQPMSIQMVWDDTYLYLAYTVQDDDVYSTINTRDVNTWNQDNVELFVMTDSADGKGYVEYEWTPREYIWDGLFSDVGVAAPPYSPASQWNSAALQVGATVNGTVNNPADVDTGFIVEVAVPWEDIYYYNPANAPPNDGEVIRMNFNRIAWDSPTSIVEGSTAKGALGSDLYFTWSPLPGPQPAFHQPSLFGYVTFSTTPVPEPASLMLLALGAAGLLRRRRR